MNRYVVEVTRHYTYEIEVHAEDEYEAFQKSRDWEIEDLEPYETNAYFDFDVIGNLDSCSTGCTDTLEEQVQTNE